MFERFAEHAIRVIMSGQEEAKRLSSSEVDTEHLLLGMIKENESIVAKVLEHFGITGIQVKEAIEARVIPSNFAVGPEIPFSKPVKKVIELAWEEARTLGHTYIGVEHIFLALLRENSAITAEVLRIFNITAQTAKAKLVSIMAEETVQARKAFIKSNTPALDTFGRDLTAMAREGKIDPVIGRSSEIERVIQILSRRKKNNPVLLGEAGVGKTAIAEGLAQRIILGDVPTPLLNKRVVSLDLGQLVAGTKFRGEFEERIKKIMDEILKSKRVILFIDEIHTLIGTGAAEGSMDAANILKPALARGELQCIGATTLSEYRKKIESDAALERRFQSITVEEPTVQDTIEIIKGLKTKYEEFHKVQITDDAIVVAARLSDRYITERKLPDKAIDLIDEASSKIMLKAIVAPPELLEINKQLESIREQKEEAVKNQEFELAAELRDKEADFKIKAEDFVKKSVQIPEDKRPVVDANAVAEVVAVWTGIPATQLTAEETARLIKMESELQKEVVGQEEGIKAIAKSIRRARTGLKNPNRPVGSFIFLGPSGVGKTYLAKKLAEFLFGDQDSLIRIDMSEYLESHSVSRLLGSPPGYVGYGEGGLLTEPVRRKPHSVVLFDEIEKAHRDVMNTLLQILDDGVATDAHGRKVDFKNTVIIMTSNVGAELFRKESSMGFITRNDAQSSYEKVKGQVLSQLEKEFKPEFLNRIDEKIVFKAISKEDLVTIVDLMIKELNVRLKEKEMTLTLSQKAKEFLADKGYDPKLGARPLRRVIEDYIEDPLSEDVLKGKIVFGSQIKGDLKDDKIVFSSKKPLNKEIIQELESIIQNASPSGRG